MSGAPFLIFLLFPLLWVLVCLILAYVSGWQALHKQFGPAPVPPPKGTLLRWARVGFVSYKNVLRISFHEHGVFLSVLFLFRSGHPPLFIPWSAFSVPEHRSFLFSDTVRTEVGKPRITTLTLPLSAVRGTFLDPAATSGPGLAAKRQW